MNSTKTVNYQSYILEDYTNAIKEFSAGIDTFRLSVDPKVIKSMDNKSKLATICQLYTNRSLCYFSLNQHDKAIEDADYVATNLDPKNAKAFFRKGLSLAKMGKTQDAIAELQRAVKLEPGNELYTNELASLRKSK